MHSSSGVSRIERGEPVTMLGVWAHPDDEAYLSTVLMHRIVESGGRVVVVTATRGELGSNDPAGVPVQLAIGREQELRAAMALIGVADVHVLGIADGACVHADPTAMTATLDDLIQFEDPDLIVTFGPDGITGHPDHRAVSQWAISAAQRGTRAQLLLTTMTHHFVARNAPLHDRIGMSMGPALHSVADHELALSIAPDGAEQRLKSQVLDAHDSQTRQLVELVGRDAFHAWWPNEMFRHPTVEDVRWADTARAYAARRSCPNGPRG